jgi:hypothetical protein
MIRWILYSLKNNELLGHYDTLKDAYKAGFQYTHDTGDHYFIEDALYDEELTWRDIE